MKRQELLVSGLACPGTGTDAAAAEREMTKGIADETDVSVNNVRMVLGSRSQHAQIRTSCDQVGTKVKATMRTLAKPKEAEPRAFGCVQPKAREKAAPL